MLHGLRVLAILRPHEGHFRFVTDAAIIPEWQLSKFKDGLELSAKSQKPQKIQIV